MTLDLNTLGMLLLAGAIGLAIRLFLKQMSLLREENQSRHEENIGRFDALHRDGVRIGDKIDQHVGDHARGIFRMGGGSHGP